MTAEAAEIKRAVTALRAGCSPSQVATSIATFYGMPLTRGVGPAWPGEVWRSDSYQAGYDAGFDHGVRVADRTWADAVATIPTKPKRRGWFR